MQFLGTNLEAANNLKDTVFRLCYRSKRLIRLIKCQSLNFSLQATINYKSVLNFLIGLCLF